MDNTRCRSGRRREMDMLRNIQGRDWTIAIIAFIAGAWIF
jgi:hypothetical protein